METATLDIERRKYRFQCPACGHQIEEKIGRLKDSPILTCPGCKQALPIDGKALKEGLAKVGRSVDKFRQTLSGIGKRR